MDKKNENGSENLSGTNEELNNKNSDANTGRDQEDGDSFSDDNSDHGDDNSFDDISELKTKLAQLEDRNRKLNHENAKHRNRAKENEKEANDAKKLALETKNALENLKKSLELQAIKSKLVEEAVKVGVTDFFTFERLIDKSALKVSETGDVSGIQEQIQSLKDNKALASLFETPKPNSTSRGFNAPPVNTETKNDVSKLDRADYQKAKAALLRSKVKR